MKNVDLDRLRLANKCLRRLKYSKDLKLCYPVLGHTEGLILEVSRMLHSKICQMMGHKEDMLLFWSIPSRTDVIFLRGAPKESSE